MKTTAIGSVNKNQSSQVKPPRKLTRTEFVQKRLRMNRAGLFISGPAAGCSLFEGIEVALSAIDSGNKGAKAIAALLCFGAVSLIGLSVKFAEQYLDRLDDLYNLDPKGFDKAIQGSKINQTVRMILNKIGKKSPKK